MVWRLSTEHYRVCHYPGYPIIVYAPRSEPSHGVPNRCKQKGKVMATQTSRTGVARKRTGSKQKNKQISSRKKHASARRNGKDAKLTGELRTLRQAEKNNRREDAALSERANGRDRDHHDEQAANQQVIPNDAPDSGSERKDRASARQHPIDREHGPPASSRDPRSMRLKARPDLAIQANGAGLRVTHASILPMQALAMAHWQFWSTAMAFYQRAWISASSPSLGHR